MISDAWNNCPGHKEQVLLYKDDIVVIVDVINKIWNALECDLIFEINSKIDYIYNKSLYSAVLL